MHQLMGSCVRPGPPPGWYVGNLPDIMRRSSFQYYNDCARKYGKVYKAGAHASSYSHGMHAAACMACKHACFGSADLQR